MSSASLAGSAGFQPHQCFISYASADLAFAELLYRRLTAEGFEVWFDKARLRPGHDWHSEIECHCESSRVVLPVLTPRWKLSEWTRYETYGAEAVIPLLAEGSWNAVATPPLGRFQNQALALDTAGEASWERLFGAIRELLAREAPVKEARLVYLRYPPNEYFVGRERTLNDIHEKLFTNPTTALTQGRIEAITALGGVGKTTLARQYAEKFWRCYRQMLWADCRKGLAAEFAAIHDVLRPEPVFAVLNDEDKARWVRWELSQSGNRPLRLLILDNAEDEDSVLAWVPKSGHCHTLITSRFTDWAAVETFPVWVLEPEPARELLLRRSGRTGVAAEVEACDAVAKSVQYLPLALEQAAAYVGAQGPGYTFSQYLQLYRANERRFLNRRVKGSTEYPDSAYLTWRATVEKLPAGSRAILRLCAFMASAPLPVDMFVKSAAIVAEAAKGFARLEDEPEEAGEYEIREWKSALARYSMVKPERNDSFSVHGLVQAVERHHADEADRPVLVQKATTIFVRWAPSDAGSMENWPVWEKLAPHAGVLWRWQREDGRVQPVPEFLERFGMFLHSRGRYADAESLLRRVLEARERVLGPEHPKTLTSVNNLALLLKNRGEYAAAEPLYRRALEAQERVLGPEHPDTLTSVSNLALLLLSRGNYTAAEPLFRRALKARERVLGPEHRDTLTSINNLAALLYKQHDYSAADPLFHRAMEAQERVLGPDNPQTIASVNNLAALLYERGDYTAAEPLYRRALESHEREMGPEHPLTLNTLNNLAVLLGSRDDYTAAEPLYRRALESRERVLGPEHPLTLQTAANLAYLLANRGDYAAAEPLQRRAMEGRERVLGAAHPDTLTSLQHLTKLFEKRGRDKEAANLRKEHRRRMASREASATPVELRQLALTCYRQGDYAGAEQWLRRVLDQGFEVPGTYCHLARVLLITDRRPEACIVLANAWEHRAQGPAYVIPRILFLQLTLAVLAGSDPGPLLGRLKSALARGAHKPWAIQPVLDHLSPRFAPHSRTLLTALAAVIGNAGKTEALNAFPEWRDAPEMPLD